MDFLPFFLDFFLSSFLDFFFAICGFTSSVPSFDCCDTYGSSTVQDLRLLRGELLFGEDPLLAKVTEPLQLLDRIDRGGR